MKTLPHPPENAGEITELIRGLADADDRLQNSTAGQADAVIGPSGDAYLLRPAQENLSLSESRLKALFKGSPDVITEISDMGQIRMQSAAITAMLGYEASALVGTSIFALVHPDDLLKFETACLASVQSRGPVSVDFRHLARDGTWHPVEASLATWRSPQESGLLLNFRGTAGRRIAQEARVAESMGASIDKDRFLAMLAHELRTPLTPVLLAVSLLERDARFAEARPMLSMIQRSVEMQSRLIADLMDFVTLGQHKLHLRLEPVDAHDAVRLVVEICQSEIAAAHIHVVLDLKATENIVRGDSLRIQQILWNVVRNAVKFSRPGGRVLIGSSNDATGHLNFRVTDEGAGIAADFLPRVFLAYQQCDDTNPRHSGGFGLGMFIARELADAQEGTLDVESEGLGKGTTFYLGLKTQPATSPGGAP